MTFSASPRHLLAFLLATSALAFACAPSQGPGPSASASSAAKAEGFLGPKGDGTCWRVASKDAKTGTPEACPDRKNLEALANEALAPIACGFYASCVGQPTEGCGVEKKSPTEGVNLGRACALKIARADSCEAVRQTAQSSDCH